MMCLYLKFAVTYCTSIYIAVNLEFVGLMFIYSVLLLFFFFVRQMRTLSCVGLLMTPGLTGKPGCLWLVDATGIYPVRAHCIGGGLSLLGKAPELVSNQVNTQLGQTDFSTLDVKEGAKRLVGLLSGEVLDGEQEQGEKQKRESLLKAGTRLEVAIAESGKRRMKRLQLLTLLDKSQ
jgi:hypothetical protein